MRLFILFLLAGVLVSSSAYAGPPPPLRWWGHRWHGDIHHFHDHDFGYWRGGRWFHGHHEGRYGWWWIVGGGWYFYSAPVYPYPDPYTPSVVLVEPAPAPAQTVVVAPSYVYYCSNPVGYYPYVPQCSGAWQKVASSAGASPPVAAQPQVVAPTTDQRTLDDRKLNSFAVELDDTESGSRGARSKLRDLEKRVEEFRQDLFERDYNAMDILKDTEDLQKRISKKISALPVKAKPAPTPEKQGE